MANSDASLVNMPSEILLIIGRYLSRRSFCSVVKTSRRLYAVFNPIFWQSSKEGLYRATLYNNVDSVRKFIKIKPDLNMIWRSNGVTALEAAVQEGNTEIVEALLDAGALMEVPRNNRAFLTAINQKHTEIYNVFIRHHPNDELIITASTFCIDGRTVDQPPEFQDVRKRAISILAARRGSEKAPEIPSGDDGLLRLLLSSILDNDIDDVRVLMQALGVDISSLPEAGVAAVQTKNVEMVELLLEEGGMDITGDSGLLMMYHALRNSDFVMARYLHENGVSLNPTSESTIYPIHGAAASHNGEVLDFAIGLGATIPSVASGVVMSVLVHAICHPWDLGIETFGLQTELPRSISLLQRLIALGASVNGVGHAHRHPLEAAVIENWPEATKLLIDNGAPVNACSYSTPLHTATDENCLEIMEILLQHGANTELIERRYRSKPLYLVMSGEAVSLLIKYGASPEGGGSRYTLLQRFARAQHYLGSTDRVGIVSALLEGGASPAAVTGRSRLQPILIALAPGWVSFEERPEIVKLLLQHGASVSAQMPGNRMQPLSCAVLREEPACVESLLEYGADIHHGTRGGINAIHWGCTKSLTSIVRTLLEHGGDPSRQTNSGWTALHIAVWRRCPELISLLLEYNTPIDTPMRGGKTALHLAVERRQENIVSMLLEHGANVNARKENGASILHTAATQDNLRIVTKLLESKASVDVQNKRGKTPLITASSLGRTLIVGKLLEHGARRDIRDNTGRTALDWALVRGHHEIVQMLQDRGAAQGEPLFTRELASRTKQDEDNVSSA